MPNERRSTRNRDNTTPYARSPRSHNDNRTRNRRNSNSAQNSTDTSTNTSTPTQSTTNLSTILPPRLDRTIVTHRYQQPMMLVDPRQNRSDRPDNPVEIVIERHRPFYERLGQREQELEQRMRHLRRRREEMNDLNERVLRNRRIPLSTTPAMQERRMTMDIDTNGVFNRNPHLRPYEQHIFDSLTELFRNTSRVPEGQPQMRLMTLNLVADEDRTTQNQTTLRRSRRINNLPPEAPSNSSSDSDSMDSDEIEFISHRHINRMRAPLQQHIQRLTRDNQDGTRNYGVVITRTYNLNEMDRIPDEEGTRNSFFPNFDSFFDPFENFSYDDWLDFQESIGNARPRDTGVKQEVFDKLKSVCVGKEHTEAIVDLTQSIPSTKHIKAAPLVTTDCACVICMSDYENGQDAILLHCKHHYHNDCLKKWFESHSTCPVCRFQVK